MKQTLAILLTAALLIICAPFAFAVKNAAPIQTAASTESITDIAAVSTLNNPVTEDVPAVDIPLETSPVVPPFEIVPAEIVADLQTEMHSGTCSDGLMWTLDNDGTLTISGTGSMTNYSNYNNSINAWVTSAPWGAYSDSIQTVIVDSGVSSIGNYAFYECAKLKNITIADSVSMIGDYAFWDCSSLESISIPDSVTSIKSYAFAFCCALTTVTVPKSVTTIGNSAFSGCNKLQSITIPFVGESRKAEEDTYQFPFGWIFGSSAYSGGTDVYQHYHGDSTTTEAIRCYCIPSSLRSVTVTGSRIPYGAFYRCSMLTDITILSDSETIDISGSAFFGCNRLISIFLPGNVSCINKSAFDDCRNLVSVIYCGTASQWEAITIESQNDPLINAERQYHAWNDGIETTAATCTEEGVITYTCTVCGEEETEAISPLGHNLKSEKVVIQEPTLTEPGIKAFVCERCGAHFNEEVIEFDPTITVICGKGYSGESAEVSLAISDNPGIIEADLTLSYSSALILKKNTVGTDGYALKGLTFSQPEDLSANPIHLIWKGSEADSSNGTLLRLTFEIPSETPKGEYPVAVSCEPGAISVYNAGSVDFTLVNSQVTVQDFVPGDIDRDGYVNAKDVTVLRRMLAGGYGGTTDLTHADFNRDGFINAKDITVLRRFLAGGYGIVLE